MKIFDLNTKSLLSTLQEQGISEMELFQYYCDGFKMINKPFISEFGRIRGEKKESSRIKYFGSKLLFKDFGENCPAVDIIGYVKKKYNCDTEQAIRQIATDYKIKGQIKISSSNKVEYSKPNTECSVIRYRSRDWSIQDEIFWGQFNITIDLLNLFKVKPLEYFWINDYAFKVKGLGYVYIIGNKRKIYQPYDSNKWFSNCTKSDLLQGYSQLLDIKYPLILITKSLKDVMSLYSCGYNAVAVNSESTWMSDEMYLNLKNKSEMLVLFYDNDIPGIKESNRLSELYGIPKITIPNKDTKDFSDLIKKYGVNTAKLWINLNLGSMSGVEDIGGNL